MSFTVPNGHPFADAGNGQAVLLVHGECECGWTCMCPEGWNWPACPECGIQVMPPKDHAVRVGYVAFQMGERDAVERIAGGAVLE